MKTSIFYGLAFVTALSAAQTARDQYKDFCDTEKSGTRQINGVDVQFTCDVKPTATLLGQQPAASAEDCISLCSDACKGALWQYASQSCQLFDYEGIPTAKSRGSLYLAPVKAANPSTGTDLEEHDCQSERMACEDVLADLEGQLAQCKEAVSQNTGTVACSKDNDKQVTVNGNDYKVYCGKISNTGANDLGVIEKIPTFNTCVNICSETPKCQRAIWSKSKVCYLRSTGKGEVPTTVSSDYDMAYLV